MFSPKFKTHRAMIVYEILKRLYFICIFAYIPFLMALGFVGYMNSGGLMELGYWLLLLILFLGSLPYALFFVAIGLCINGIWTLKTRKSEHKKAMIVYIVSFAVTLVMLVLMILSVTFQWIDGFFFIFGYVISIQEMIFLPLWQRNLKKDIDEYTENTDDSFTHKLSVIGNTVTVSVITVLILAVLLIPFDVIRYADGGTVKTIAIAYAVVEWNRGKNEDLTVTLDQEDLQYADEEQHTCFYFFPHNFKSYDELWDMKH